MDPIDAVEVANANRDVIVGIKVRVGRMRLGQLRRRAARHRAARWPTRPGMPLMAHIDHPPPSYEEVVERLRPGDVLTHASGRSPTRRPRTRARSRRRCWRRAKRGVRFDIGHGKGSFAFKTARAMLANGFLPDTISSDVHALCINGPAFDQVTTMSKFLCMGMPLTDVIAASTVNAAMALKRPELGSLKPGSVGDATDPDGQGGPVRLRRRGRRAPGGRPQDRLGGRRRRRPLVAPEGLGARLRSLILIVSALAELAWPLHARGIER